MLLRNEFSELISYRNLHSKLYRICRKANISGLQSKHIVKPHKR